MRSFECDRCGSPLSFDATRCPHCRCDVGYLPSDGLLRALLVSEEPAVLVDAASGRTWWRCLNAAWGCNWMTPVDDGGTWCRSCALTRGRPDMGRPEAIDAWRGAEADKRRLVHQLDVLGLPIGDRSDEGEPSLTFDLVHLPGHPALTGYADGVITLDLTETDDSHRAALRHQLREPYRTVLGHLRHEVGHHYWNRLVGQSDHVPEFRRLFGDERADYTAALDSHYATPQPDTHDDRYISFYAGAHPHEDWAETFAQYLHLIDACETATAQGLTVETTEQPCGTLPPFAVLVDTWQPVAEAVNALAASLGQPPLYPFTLSKAVVDKLSFVHERVTAHAQRARFYAQPA